MQTDYEHVTYAQVTSQPAKQFPFDLNKLCNFNLNFDILKSAIEYLSKQQNDQQVMIVNLIKSVTKGGVVAQEVSVSDPEGRYAEHVGSDDERASVVQHEKDWRPLMADFDRRLGVAELK